MTDHPATAVCNVLEITAITHGIKDYNISIHQHSRMWYGYLSWDAILIHCESPITMCITMNDEYDQATPQNYIEWKWQTKETLKHNLADFRKEYCGYQ